MMRHVFTAIVMIGGLTLTPSTERVTGGEWLGYGYVGPVAYSVGSPYGYYYYAGYYPSQVVSYPYGLYGYYYPYRYNYGGYPYGYYGSYVAYPVTYPASYAPTYSAVVPTYPAAVPADYPVPAGYKLVPANAACSASPDAKESDRSAGKSADNTSSRSANADGTLPPAPTADGPN